MTASPVAECRPTTPVSVQFSPVSPEGRWDFAPHTVTLTESGDIRLTRKLNDDGSEPDWLFAGGFVIDGGRQFSVQIEDFGKRLVIDDRHEHDNTSLPYTYVVVVQHGGRAYASDGMRVAEDPPPPQIINAG
jgi:hypothetical protein